MMHTNKHVVVVGDRNQLAPTCHIRELKGTNILRSFFDRMYELGVEPARLNTQYRMHPGLLAFPNHEFYRDIIQSAVEEEDRQLREKGQESILRPFINPKQPCCCFQLNGR